jgi:Ca2+-binding RTX toxin-like protein
MTSSSFSPNSFASQPFGLGAGFNGRLGSGDDKVRIEKTGYDEYKVTINGEDHFLTRAQLEATHFDLGAGNDQMYVDASVDARITVNGGAGDDRIKGGSGNDTIMGGSGNDRLRGGAGDDHIYGNSASSGGSTSEEDKISGGDGNDWLYGSNGNDRLSGGNGDDTIQGGRGDDRINGNAGNDVADGGAGDDSIYGGKGADRLYGGAGNDIFYTGNDDDRDIVDGGSGKDKMKSQNADEDRVISAERDTGESGKKKGLLGMGGFLGFL